MEPLAKPRFPTVPEGKGHYESWYLKAGKPGGPAIWIRYTVHKRPGSEPEGSVWFTLFDADADRPFAVKQTGEPGALGTGPEIFVATGDFGEFAPGRADGWIAGAGREASWRLEISGDEPPLEHFPARFYGGRLPRTKLLTVQPAAIFSGTVEAGGRRLDLDGWAGMIGHNWGTQHAERWIWLHGTDFPGHGPGTWIDLAFGQVKLGPWTTPWIANGAISLDGTRHRLGGIGASLRGTRVEARPGLCSFSLPGSSLRASGTVRAEARNTVAWRYADPDGSEHHTLNCSISGFRLEVTPDTGDTLSLETATGGTFEFGSRDTAHGIPVEPFADG